MDAPPDLVRASREELIALIVAQREEIAALRREHARQAAEIATLEGLVAELTARVGELLAALAGADGDDAGARPTTMPGLKPAATGTTPRTRPRRANGAPHGYGRRRMPPTARQVHAYARCPPCQTPLRGGTRQRRREVIEVIPARVVVTEHVYVERRCPRCHGRWQPGPELDGRGGGAAALRRGAAEPDRHLARGAAAAHPRHPVVSGDGAWAVAQRGRHRRGAAPAGGAGGAGGGRPPGGDPRRPGAARR